MNLGYHRMNLGSYRMNLGYPLKILKSLKPLKNARLLNIVKK